MENYIIPPLEDLDLMDLGNGNRYFCLANFYISDQNYRKTFLELRKKDVFITLDCGSAEGETVTMDQYIDIIEELLPNEAIALDILFDKFTTISSFNKFEQKLTERGLLDKVDIFACPQGSTKEEWLECYDIFNNKSNVKTIGLSKIAVPKAFLDKTSDEGIKEARNECVRYLINNNKINKNIHFLGMGDPTEFEYYKTLQHPLLRSTDSCYTVLAGKNNIMFDEGNFTRIKTTNDFYHNKLSYDERDRAIRNIKWFCSYIK